MNILSKIKAEIFFLIFGLIFGTVLLIINPPIQAPDEDAHLFKMWGMLDGSFNFKIYDGYKVAKIPESIAIIVSNYDSIKHNLDIHTSKKEILSYLKLSLKKDKTVYYRYTPTGYTIVSYFPQIICLFVLKILNVPPFFMLYILRFFCLVCYLTLIYQAIKITPCKKWMFAILGLLPVNLYIAGAINTDCLVIGVSFLLIAYTMRLKFCKKITTITNKQILFWGILFTYLCVLKYLYFPLILIYFLLPKEKFQSSKKYYLIFFLISVINITYILCFMLYTICISKIGITVSNNIKFTKLQLIQYIFYHIPHFIFIIILTAIIRLQTLFITAISQFGWRPFFVPNLSAIIFYIVIFLSCFYKNEKEECCKYNTKERILMIIPPVSIYSLVLLTIFVLYLSYPIIDGWQGRYGSPYFPLLIMAITGNKFSFSSKWIVLLFLIIVPILYLSAFEVVLQRFY